MKRYSQRGGVIIRNGGWLGFYREYELDPSTGKTMAHRRYVGVVGRVSKMRKSDARHEVQKLVEKALGSRKPVAAGDMELEAFVEQRWLPANQSGWSANTTLHTNLGTLKNQVYPRLGEIPLTKIDLQCLQVHLGELQKKGYSEDVITRVRGMLRSIFELAVEEERIAKNPAKKLKLPANIKAKNKSTFQFKQLRAFLREVSRLPARDRLLLKTAVVGNLRPGELFGLDPIDLVGNELHLRRTVVGTGVVQEGITKTKGKDRKRVAIPPDLAKELREYINKELANVRGPLFPNINGGRLQKDNYRVRVIGPLKKRMHVDTLDLRMLRRTASTHQLKYGTVTDLQGQLRHAKPTTALAEYTQIIPESQHKMVNRYWKDLNKSIKQRRRHGS